MEQEVKTMLVKRKEDGEIQNIKAYRFNPEYHKKLPFHNWWRDNIKSKKFDWNNQAVKQIVIPVIVAVVSGIILFLIFGK